MCDTANRIPDLDRCPVCDLQWKYTVPCDRCDGTGKLVDGQPCDAHLCSYNPDTGRLDGPCGAHCCRDGVRGPFSRLIGVEYAYPHPDRHDGVSEWQCRGCGSRWGRWTGNVLVDGETEPRFGQRRGEPAGVGSFAG
jgi:hypothetical protein